MEYDNFIETIRQRAVKTAGEGGKAFINKVIKNNGKEMDGLVILEDGYNIAPTIYLNDYYKDFQSGADINDIMNDILTTYYKNRDAVCFNTEIFNDFDNIKNSIVFKLVNYEKNKSFLSEVPHKRRLDLAMVYYCIVKKFDNHIATTIIKNDLIDRWGINSDELFEVAMKNAQELLAARITPITGFLDEISGSKNHEVLSDTETSMYVMTNISHINGAACLFYDGILESFSKKLRRNLYILPSSVHELIIVPAEKGISKKALGLIVKDINEKGVASDEVLSDNVYEYRYKEQSLIL